MEDTKEYLEAITSKVAADLIRVYSHSRSNQAGGYGLSFPRKRDGSLRVSEQESKFLFGQHLTLDQRFHFSVETPTSETYQQTGAGPISARTDLTIYGQDLQRAAHIELKAHYDCSVENIRKDLEKLVREQRTGVWFHTLEREDNWRLKELISKFREAFERLSDHLQTTNTACLVSFLVLETGLLRWKWLQFTGELGRNLSAVHLAFDESSLDSASWTTYRIKTDQVVAFNPDSIHHQQTSKGKGAREGFFVLVPSVASNTFVHLSIRGGSYRIRNYQETGSSRPPRPFRIPSYPTLEALRESGLIAQWVPITSEDSRYNVDTKPGY